MHTIDPIAIDRRGFIDPIAQRRPMTAARARADSNARRTDRAWRPR